MKKGILLFVFYFILNTIQAQIGVGEWRDHLPFNYSIDITESSRKVYLASEQGVFSYNKSSNSIEKFTKVNKLSDIGISTIKYSKNNKVLLVGYSNGNLDMIFDNEVFNLSDIKREMISGSKSINHILFKDNYAYLSCGFGVVVVNIEKREIKDTYYIGDLGSLVQVNQLYLNNNYLYAATKQGIYVADITNQNLIDYSNWQRITSIPNYTSSFNTIFVSDDYILANQNNESTNDVLYAYTSSTGLWETFINEYEKIHNIVYSNSEIQIVTNENILLYNSNLISKGSISQTNIPSLNPSNVVYGADNNYWIADYGYGLNRYKSGSYDIIYPNAPYTVDAYGIEVVNDIVYISGGGVGPKWSNKYINGVIHIFKNERWSSHYNYSAKDFLNIAVDPYNNNHYYVSSWLNGLIEYSNNQPINYFTDENSSIQTMIPGDDYFLVGCSKFDNNNNLWITNNNVQNPISVKKENGDWKSFNFDGKISDILVTNLIITKDNNKWVLLPNGNGLFVFNENQTIDNENDDLTKKLNVIDGNGKIISNHVYSIAEDLEGQIWVGTDVGIVIYNRPELVFEDNNFHAERVVLTIGDVTQYLLNTEVVTSIAVDGANQKWLGTASSGVYLVSDDGTEEVYHFTKENSPLLSNNIFNIGINHESGEVFFATDKGLISYRGSATMGSDEFRDVYVYPNPVRENYTGKITIRGLVSDVNVKITDISGNLVYETQADGGQATWDGKDFSGRRPSTGVYLVFCTNEDGSKTYITKFLFIR